MKIGTYAQGTPSWVDLGASDQVAAKKFYSSIFGWTYHIKDSAGNGSMILSMAMKDGSYVAGIYTQRSAEAEKGIPPYWMSLHNCR